MKPDVSDQMNIVQMNQAELELLTGVQDDVAAGINVLRDAGLRSVIVTAGRQGIFGFVGGRWAHAHAYDVPVWNDVDPDDVVAGVIVAGLRQDLPLHQVLRRASAAAALRVSGEPLPESGEELDEVAGTLMRIPLRRREPTAPTRALFQSLPVQAVLRTAALVLVGSGVGYGLARILA